MQVCVVCWNSRLSLTLTYKDVARFGYCFDFRFLILLLCVRGTKAIFVSRLSLQEQSDDAEEVMVHLGFFQGNVLFGTEKKVASLFDDHLDPDDFTRYLLH
ncbi:hypothetical protein QVD17_38079 [Tagetes erecta]|uniref:Uncharacterized protein n=1 Tax=Tagetes erecta TaxID=13708 RepID=A0AAD8NJ39_TARER|nr:hypothetical protein QVD17_38079 [Tagetes erecta]